MLAKLTAIWEAVKLAASIFKFVGEAYEQWQEKRIHKHYEKKRKVKEKVTQQIEAERQKPKEEQNDENLKNLLRRLHNLGGK